MTATATVRLVPPAPAQTAGAAVVLDETQETAVATALAGPATLVVGAPGTGKTTVAREVAVRAITSGTDPSRVLVLAATRRSAARLRDEVAAGAARTIGAPMVRTAASAAFSVLRTRAAALGEPPPTLVSGPEQDLVLAELLAGHLAGEGTPLPLPPGLPEESLGLRGLRQELRDLLMRAAERGLTPVELDELGRRHERPEWQLAARLYEEYLDVTALRLGTPDAGSRYDPAVVVDEAAHALAAWDVPGVAAPTWDLVVVDDHQESTVATARLLGALHDAGARLVLLADPDAAVQGFRGAAPGLVGRAAARPGEVGAFDARTVVLGSAWRQPELLREVTRAITSRVATVSGALHRVAAPRPDLAADDGAPTDGTAVAGRAAQVDVAVLAGAAQEAAYIARELRAEHLLHGTPWERMVVLARSGDRLAALRRDLVAASVPVALLGSDVPLRDEPAVVPLLAALRVCAGPGGLDRMLAELRPAASPDDGVASGDAATEDAGLADGVPSPVGPDPLPALDAETAALLLTSPVGGLDAVSLRRLRRALRAEELSGGGGRSSDALLVEVLGDPARAATLPPAVRRGPVAVARVLAAGRAAAAVDGATAQTVLWAVWAATGLADRWRDTALSGGPAGVRADRDLDAVLALFRAAETYVERMPGAPVAAFVDYVTSQDLPADSLAAAATGARAVEALTPAGAAGREWDVVVVAGVQDGVWPDLRLRDSLLGSQALVELLAGRAQDAHGVGKEARAQVLADELRAFAVAISRARRRLLVTAVEDAEDSPSVFCDLVSPRDGGDTERPDPRRVPVGPPLDLRGVVAAARAELVRSATARLAAQTEHPTGGDAGLPVDDGGTDPRAETAAALLARLADAGVPEADPRTWYGVAQASSDAPLWGPQDEVVVSPSKVDTVTTCALRWAFESAGGTAPDATHQTLGTLVHSIAEEHPAASLSVLRGELDRRWPELALPEGWPSRQLRRRAEEMLARLAEYYQDSGEPVLIEPSFDLTLGRARLRGKIDRVEADGEDAVTVADLKTGRSAPSRDKAAENPQLGAYQLAVTDGALDLPEGTRSAGARLVFVGTPTKGPSVRDQQALEPGPDGSSWARSLVEEAADTMAASAFAARENDLCSMCPVRRSCPVQTEGRSVIS
ncbi:PD-(D/E)XK nuclease family protein [Isoptericola croceus]|uniref:PD-(D/E)XK nuclease family protein n=1 Tax=Isoptericola croceus TaxID=3031406 RepID=UPI0023F732E9|nr:ATP-dependent DNA helicase [Isoptericola croceus]